MDQNMWHDAIRFGLVRIFYPCLMIFGTIGNILCLKILLRKRFRRQSTCQYLCILAVIDMLFIYTRLARYLYRHIYNVDLRNTSLWTCRTFIFFSSTLSHLASWILVVVSFDRYFLVKNLYPPYRVGWRVIRSTSVLIFVVCIANAYYFYILGTHVVLQIPLLSVDNGTTNEIYYNTTRFVCMVPLPFQEFFRLYVPIYDLLFVAIIPFCLMTFTNIGIIRTTMRSKICANSRKQQRNNRLTIMLLSVILAFMLLTCPSVIYICLNRLASSRAFSNTKLLVVDLFESLLYTKHALNFILYTLSGQDFRREFIKLISCYRRRTPTTLNNRHRYHRSVSNVGASVFTDQSPVVNRRLLECEDGEQLHAINDSLGVIYSRSLKVRIRHTTSNGNCITLTARSSAQTGTSTTSDTGRSSSTTKTSVQ